MRQLISVFSGQFSILEEIDRLEIVPERIVCRKQNIVDARVFDRARQRRLIKNAARGDDDILAHIVPDALLHRPLLRRARLLRLGRQ